MKLFFLVSSPQIQHYSHSLFDDIALGLEFYTISLQVALGYTLLYMCLILTKLEWQGSS